MVVDPVTFNEAATVETKKLDTGLGEQRDKNKAPTSLLKKALTLQGNSRERLKQKEKGVEKDSPSINSTLLPMFDVSLLIFIALDLNWRRANVVFRTVHRNTLSGEVVRQGDGTKVGF